ncbi:MAG: 50S ribosomal protein L13 [Candidatus Wolfebacteria bacterium GW2011_GWC1_43_10]|uniref:50S ribosomal protein L13 n=1 Tax=Candidatus Wolfebacteria bacterium GW2011_GWC1_43_10 TaxID=1619011 RepID=A0A0G1CCI1_9BACT|nr:MAG: 50S ribosomal protein L13 [Candidatus Wolfebacteria bacterium GW2011_GWC1_43_10]KKT22715.1 MAG: 50S ribosomal protein L13 [Parcubacteria group bacterium GW2011_GWB1_43_8b]
MADYIIDCKDKRFGRIASEIAVILQGKKNPGWEPRLAGDDRVIVKNVKQLSFSGNKASQKIYYSHTTQIGHLKKRKLKDVLEKHGSQYVLKKAVLNMLPKNKLRAKRIRRLIFE